MNILVITPDSDIGCRVVSELLSPEFKVRVITDDPAAFPNEWCEQVEVITDPMENARTLRRTLADTEAVLWCLPTGMDQEAEPLAHTLSRTMRETGVPRLVTVSTMDCGFIGNADIISSQSAIEDILNKSGAAIRHLRCIFPMEKLLSQEKSIVEEAIFSLSTAGNIIVPLLVTDGVLDMVLKCLVRQDWAGIERMAISNPRLTHHRA
jgi:uncharacterized protein YbjT (DUF2867 family)